MEKVVCVLKNRYCNISKPAKASLWFAVANILRKGIQFLVVPLYTRLMTTEQYGEYSVFFSWQDIIRVFATLMLFNYVFNNGMIKYANDKNNFIASLVGVSTTSTLLCCIVYFVFFRWFQNVIAIPNYLMILMFLEFFLMASFEYWCSEHRFSFEYKPVVIGSISMSLLTPVVAVVMMYNFQERGQAAILARVLVAIGIYIWPFLIVNKRSHAYFNKEYWKFILGFSIPLIPHQLSFILLQQSDRVMINSICGASEAGIYSLAYSVAMVLLIFNDAILMSYNSWLYQKIKAGGINDIRKVATRLVILVAVLNCTLMLIAPECMSILGTKEYRQAVYAIAPVAASVFFMFLFNLFVGIEYYYEKTNLVVIATVIAVVFNIVMNLICIPKFGFIAAAYTTLAGYIIMALMHYAFMKKVQHENTVEENFYDIKVFVVISFSIIGFLIVSVFLIKMVLLRYILILLILFLIFFNRKKLFEILNLLNKKM